MDYPLLDAADILRDWVRWQPVDRATALRACSQAPVAVVHRQAAGDVADWLHPSSRFFSGNGPYLYSHLRYFLHTGSRLGKLKGLKVNLPAGESEWEEMEAEEAVPLGSPTSQTKPKPKLPIEFHLVDPEGNPRAGIRYEVILPDGTAKTGKSDADGFIRFPDNIHKGEARLKLFPEQGHTPADAGRTGGSPAKPGLEADLDAGLSALPLIPEIPGIPRPVQILLADEHGVPMPNTPFQVRWPDGKAESGKSDRAGLISFPKNTQSGDLVLTVTDFGPHLPGAPAAPNPADFVPQAPAMPEVPTAPTAPSAPSAPTAPTAPSAPSAPAAPFMPGGLP